MDDSIAKNCVKCDRPDTADNLVGCDVCESWMHYDCAGVTDSIANSNRTWKCDRCRSQDEEMMSRLSRERPLVVRLQVNDRLEWS